MKKLQAICAATLLVLAFSLPTLADDGIIGMGDKPPQPPPSNTTSNSTTTSGDDSTDVVSYVVETELCVARGLVGLL